MLRRLFFVFVLLLNVSVTSSLQAEHPDVAFYVAQKFAFHDQDGQGNITVAGYFYNGEVFVKPDGKVLRATMTGSGPEAVRFELKPRDYLLVAGGGPFSTQAEVDAAFPNDSYRFDIETAHGGITDRIIPLGGKDGKTEIAPAPRITLMQNGKPASVDNINANLDLQISWTPFAIGAADSNGILDDLVTAVTEDCHGEVINRTPLPFYGDKPPFSFRDTQHTIPAGTLQPGQAYTTRVEHINIVYSNEYQGMPELASYGSVTRLAIRTSGKDKVESCE